MMLGVASILFLPLYHPDPVRAMTRLSRRVDDNVDHVCLEEQPGPPLLRST
jgi:hypothetical protein